ncbi:hypothetical protein PHMEG_0006664 [Phytophthora megakarya]|uniref:Uncharacterized protein n=1 Tax=Phytophthora megakarya TaxID=4795 RepID=A0A225WNE2_9STRA|nr:hypothetical protein PHMEG_0006664 [Phytophthora megakarya]
MLVKPDLHGNTCDLHGKRNFAISSLRQVDEYASSKVTMSGSNEVIGDNRIQICGLNPDHEVTSKLMRPTKISEY